MIDNKKLDEYISTLEEMLLFFRDYRTKKREESLSGDYLVELHHLKDMLRSASWPAAVPPESICDPNSVQDKIARAVDILSEVTPLANLSFLDFGCGEGHIAVEAANTAKLSVGYDPKGVWLSNDVPNLHFTRELDKAKSYGPFDVILIWDVLDHCDAPLEVLKTAKSMRRGNGPIYVRCHPWTSRHATHLYHQINKAYLHLIFSEKELLTLGYKGMKTGKILKPVETYKQWFVEAGLEVKIEKPSRAPVEDFFRNDPAIKNRLKQNWSAPMPDLSIEFVDYILA